MPNHLKVEMHIIGTSPSGEGRGRQVAQGWFYKRADTLRHVYVMKKAGGWRVTIDFIDLNKNYPNDNFPLPKTN